MHLVDSSSLVAILLGEPSGIWLRDKLDELKLLGGVFINQIVYSEICAMASSEKEAREWLDGLVERVPLNWECSFPAGQAYRLQVTWWKERPDASRFMIAAHANSLGWTLVTNNPSDVKNYFPKLRIVSPEHLA